MTSDVNTTLTVQVSQDLADKFKQAISNSNKNKIGNKKTTSSIFRDLIESFIKKNS
jgi:hypothetical protein